MMMVFKSRNLQWSQQWLWVAWGAWEGMQGSL
jgi:hypothetical protein